MTMDLKQYRLMDLGLLTLLAVIAQVVGTFLHDMLPGAGFYVNFAVLITLVAIYRWGIYGTAVLMLSGIPMVFMGLNGRGVNLLLNVVAAGSIALVAVLLQKTDPEDVLFDTLKLFGLTVITYVILAIGQGLSVMFLGEAPLETAVMYFLANTLNMIMTYVVLLLVRKRPGLMIDMKTYFEREQNNHEYSS